jgi:predicted phage terminase large subunit-like protein
VEGAWLLDLVDERLDFPATVAMIKAMHRRHGFGELLCEKKANGAAVIKTLTAAAHGYRVVEAGAGAMGSKESRANAASVEVNAGRVYLPRSAPWSTKVVDQLIQFPAATFDDIVDQTSQLLIYLIGSGPLSFSTVSWGHGATRQAVDTDGLRQQGWSDDAIMALQTGLIRR